MEKNRIQINWVNSLSVIYLLLPFIIFCLTFLKIWIGLPIAVLISILVWVVLSKKELEGESVIISKSDLLFGVAILSMWVLLSGIGGYAFQNGDHLTRNTIFSDLINNHWPVYYLPSSNPQISSISALVYYIGYWLPAALIGKLFGWHVANAALFTWTLLGIFLTGILLKNRIKTTFLATALFLIFFSGMDILGTLTIRAFFPNGYPTIWPPTQAIEWWIAGSFQFSSFTTQLFWVFNQSVPAWLAIALIINSKRSRLIFLIWALCFFSAPLPAIGMLPFVLLTIPNQAFNPENISIKLGENNTNTLLSNLLSDLKNFMSIENILGGGIVFLLSVLYFSTNPTSSSINLVIKDPLVILFYVIFLVYEVLLLWIIFYNEKRNNLWWYAVGGLLITIPLIRMGTSTDFGMRASIPALFLLMIWSGEALFRRPRFRYRSALIILLLIGALSPLYEINRSLYRTEVYIINTLSHSEQIPIPATTDSTNFLPEYVHPATLTADRYGSVLLLNPEYISNYIGNPNKSFFFNYLAGPP